MPSIQVTAQGLARSKIQMEWTRAFHQEEKLERLSYPDGNQGPILLDTEERELTPALPNRTLSYLPGSNRSEVRIVLIAFCLLIMQTVKNKRLGQKADEERHCIWIESKTDFLELFSDLTSAIDIDLEDTLVLKNGNQG